MASLMDVCVALVSGLCVALLVYGAWLCVPGVSRTVGRNSPKESLEENASEAAEAVVRQPRARVRAGASGR